MNERITVLGVGRGAAEVIKFMVSILPSLAVIIHSYK